MRVIVDGVEKELGKNAKLSDVVPEGFPKGASVSIHKSTESLKIESDDFLVTTTKGGFVVHLDGKGSEIWKNVYENMSQLSARWVTGNIAAFGSFATNIESNREESFYKKYDCFFSLGGYDNSTTYFMVARRDHKGSYGAKDGRIGRVTRGRHVLDSLDEGDSIISVSPAVSESVKENYIVTSNLKTPLEDGNIVETKILVEVNMDCPESAEHLMIISDKGYVNVTQASGGFAGCYDDTDVEISEEKNAVRTNGQVFVRNTGTGRGKTYFYKERRQLSEAHNHVGNVLLGKAIIGSVSTGDKMAVETIPPRTLSIGMRMSEGEALLRSRGIDVVRDGDTSDDAIIVEQIPERTVDLFNNKKGTLHGMPADKVFRISLDRKKQADVHYFEKITGLNHKPVGILTVHFWFDGMSMVTFEGDETKGKSLYPGEHFTKCKKGDIGFTNQACDNHGLLGIRMKDSKEYGPTGEEAFGTNIFGRFLGDLKKMTDGLEEGDKVYITEMEL